MTNMLSRAAWALAVILAVAPPAVAVGEHRNTPPGCSSRTGSFAFHYGSSLKAEDLAWLRRFRIVVPGDVLPADQVRALRRAGSQLFVYAWLTGLYGDEDGGKAVQDSWGTFVRHDRPRWLLNAGRPDAGPDGRGRAYYYDPFPKELAQARATRWADTVQRASYSGVFFDLVGSLYLPESLRREYDARHPEVSFDVSLSEHVRALKRRRPGTVIFTNQGYRIPDVYLPLADYDLSESLMTSYAGGDVVTVRVEGAGEITHRETFYTPWEQLQRIVDGIDGDAKRYNPAAKIFHLNYATPLLRPTGHTQNVGGTEQPVFRTEVNRPAIYYAYAAAKLWGHESFTASAPVQSIRDEIYFADLGRPLGRTWEAQDGLVRRYYDNGIVVLNPAASVRTASLRSPWLPHDVKDLWDCYAGKAVGGLDVTIAPTVSASTGGVSPAGRVYLHRR